MIGPRRRPTTAKIPCCRSRGPRIALSEASAWAKMQLSGEAAVSGDLLLIALLRADDSLRENLEALGLRLDRLEAAVLPEPGPPIEMEEERPAADVTGQIDATRVIDACATAPARGCAWSRIIADLYSTTPFCAES